MRRHMPPLWAFGVILLLAALACSAAAASRSFSVSIQSPSDGTLLPVDVPFNIQMQATDPTGPGVQYVELFVDGESRWTSDPDITPQGTLNAAVTWTPDTEGDHTLMAIAYREDGTASAPARIEVTVVALTPLDDDSGDAATEEASGDAAAQADAEASSESGGAPPPGANAPVDAASGVEARVTIGAFVRAGPGPFCEEIGGIEAGKTITVYELSQDGYWYKTDFLGPDNIGWVWIDLVTVTGDASLIHQGNVPGCIGCGDEVCNGDETCNSCPDDCGQCCGNGTCEGDYGEDCGTCAADCGDCCGNGTCEAGRGETCDSCEADCGDCCGNDRCDAEYGENHDRCPADCEAEGCEVSLTAPVGTITDGPQTFVWTAVPGADNYQLDFFGAPDAPIGTVVIAPDTTSFTIDMSMWTGGGDGNEFYVEISVYQDDEVWCSTGNYLTREP